MRSRRNRLLVFISTALAVLLTPALLLAHARLLRSSPAARSTNAVAPSELRFWFSERPELRFSRIELVDSVGTVIPLGALIVGDSMSLTAPISRPLAAGRYSVAWRTAAADGHSTSGRFSFVVTRPIDTAVSAPVTPTGTPDTSVDEVITRGSFASANDDPIARATRWIELTSLMLFVGAIVFRLFVLPRAQWPITESTSAAARARTTALIALVLFLVADVVRLVGMSSLMSSGAPSPAVAATIVPGMTMFSVLRETRWGHGWTFGAVAAVFALITLLSSRAVTASWMAAGLGAVAVCVGEAMTGHSGAMGSRAPIAVALDVAHVIGASGWLGGLACVVICGLSSLRLLDPQRRALAGSQLVRSYHHAAVECVVLTILTAATAAWLRLPRLEDLWTTPYGLALLRKVVVVLFALFAGLYHWRTAVIKDWTAATASRFRISASIELVLGLVVLALTVVLISTELPG